MSDKWVGVADEITNLINERLGGFTDPEVISKVSHIAHEARSLIERAHDLPENADRYLREAQILEAHIGILAEMAKLKGRGWRAFARDLVSIVKVAITIAAAVA